MRVASIPASLHGIETVTTPDGETDNLLVLTLLDGQRLRFGTGDTRTPDTMLGGRKPVAREYRVEVHEA